MIRLKGKKYISELFKSGKRIKSKPLQLIFRQVSDNETKIGVSVPKRKVALAVKRNRLKRQMREAIRLNPEISELKNNYHMMWLYDGKLESTDYQTIKSAAERIINKLEEND